MAQRNRSFQRATGGDPVRDGLVASLNRPGGNVTGVMSLNVELTAKRLGLLRELAPQATRFVALVSPNAVMTEATVKDVHASVPTLGFPSKSFTRAIAIEGRDCGAAKIQRTAENAPRRPDMNT